MTGIVQTRIGVIDLGTNSVRFDVHQVNRNGVTHLLHREKLMVRLGENLFIDGKLDATAIKRTLEAFSSFKRTAQDLKVGKLVAFATSAVREAKDGGEFVKTIRGQTGIDLQVIEGREEARLIARGILSHRSTKGKFALVDIGGGSTEISVCCDRKVVHSQSFPLGVARIQQLFLKTSPPTSDAVQAARSHIRKVLAATFDGEDWPKVDRIIGSSGTIRNLDRIAKKSENKKLGRVNLKRIARKMCTMTPDQLSKIPGIEPKRVDLIVAGAILLEECLIALKAKKVSLTTYSLRDGILQQVIRDSDLGGPAASKIDLTPLFARAAQFGIEKPQLKRMVTTAEKLFDRLRPLHRLETKWRNYLSAAVIFRDVGKAISPIHHERHSYYIVKHTDLPVDEEWETEFVAQLCLLHDGGKLDLDKLPFQGERREIRVKAFQKLLALLRIVDALDPAYQDRMSKKQIRINPEKVLLRLSKGSRLELALLRLQQKKALFEKVFARLLTAKTA